MKAKVRSTNCVSKYYDVECTICSTDHEVFDTMKEKYLCPKCGKKTRHMILCNGGTGYRWTYQDRPSHDLEPSHDINDPEN